jgi:hypothetical protein
MTASAGPRVPPVVLLLGSFAFVVWWFDYVDYYHRHFFDTGIIVLADNLARIVFVGLLSWLIYAPGSWVIALLSSANERAVLSRAERAVFGFGIGVGIWHIVMLTIGVLNLYYRNAIVGLCALVLLASAKSFSEAFNVGWRTLAEQWALFRQHRASSPSIGVAAVAFVAICLFFRHGIFPGGAGDYYTHYFYYYLAVLKNHGLSPNDVWYHYYYSKGDGLVFLGMLLSDPQATPLTTYVCVLFATIAIWTLAARMAPGSLWPTASTLVYLLFYLFGSNSLGTGEGEFERDHETVAALVTLFSWALCMEYFAPSRLCRIMAAASAIAASIVTQAVGVLLGVFVGMLGAVAMLRRRWRAMWGYALVAASIALSVLVVYFISYDTTGMASDQPLGLMLRFADLSKLDRWGVLPQMVAVAWIRHNYQITATPFGLKTAYEDLVLFMRLHTLWPFLAGPLITAAAMGISSALAKTQLKPSCNPVAASFAAFASRRLGGLVVFLATVSLAAGHEQSVSFMRLSSFFVPLLVLLAVAGSVRVIEAPCWRHRESWVQTTLPIALLIAFFIVWKPQDHYKRLVRDTPHTVQYAIGYLSLAQAYMYTYTTSGSLYGGLHPGTLAAAQQLPPDTPIWSTNTDSNCMAPGCLIESVISFKMSGQLDDILGGTPDLAKQRLQEAGLNYFLFRKDSLMLDLLPYSRLFAPDVIGQYLGIRWTDGTTYLLTWIGPETKPIQSDFLGSYVSRRTEADTQGWFRFADLAPQIVTLTPKLRSAPDGKAAEQLLVWH